MIDGLGFVLIGALVLTSALLTLQLLRPLFSPRWDFFLSHSSKELDIAIAVEQQLRAKGVRVWLDAREVDAAREGFRGPISRGLLRSHHGLLFTSTSYWSSFSCREEARFLLQRFRRKPDHIVEVRLEPNDGLQRFGAVGTLHIDCDSAGSAESIAAEILRRTGLSP